MMFKSKIVEILSNVEAFHGLKEEEIKLFVKKGQRITFEDREVLIKEGQEVDAFNVLIKGELKVYLPQDISGKEEHRVSEVALNVLQTGDCIGEYSVIDKMPASASVRATQAGEMFKIPEEDFNQILSGNEHLARVIYYNMLRILIRRLRKKDKEYDLIMVIN